MQPASTLLSLVLHRLGSLALIAVALLLSCAPAAELDVGFAEHPADPDPCATAEDCSDPDMVCSPAGYCEPPTDEVCIDYDPVVDAESAPDRFLAFEIPNSGTGTAQNLCDGEIDGADCTGMLQAYVDGVKHYALQGHSVAQRELDELKGLVSRNDSGELWQYNDRIAEAYIHRQWIAEVVEELQQYLDGDAAAAAAVDGAGESSAEAVGAFLARAHEQRALVDALLVEGNPEGAVPDWSALYANGEEGVASASVARPQASLAAVVMSLPDCVDEMDRAFDDLAAGHAEVRGQWRNFCVLETYPRFIDQLEVWQNEFPKRLRAEFLPPIAELRDTRQKLEDYYDGDHRNIGCADLARVREMPLALLSYARAIASGAIAWETMFPIADARVTYHTGAPDDGTCGLTFMNDEPFGLAALRFRIAFQDLRIDGNFDNWPSCDESVYGESALRQGWRRVIMRENQGHFGAADRVQTDLNGAHGLISGWTRDDWRDVVRIANAIPSFLSDRPEWVEFHRRVNDKLAGEEARAFWLGLGAGVGCGALTAAAGFWSGPAALAGAVGGGLFCAADFWFQASDAIETGRLYRHLMTIRQFGVSTSLVPDSATTAMEERWMTHASAAVLAVSGLIGDWVSGYRIIDKNREALVFRNYHRFLDSAGEGSFARRIAVRIGPRPKTMPAEAVRHVAEGELAPAGTHYAGKWNGQGLHDWNNFEEAMVRDGYEFVVLETLPSGVGRVNVKRVNPADGARYVIKKTHTLWPRRMSSYERVYLGDLAYRIARSHGEPGGAVPVPKGIPWISDPSRQIRYRAGSAGGSFSAPVLDFDGHILYVMGHFDSNGEITSYFPTARLGTMTRTQDDLAVSARTGLTLLGAARSVESGRTACFEPLLNAIESLGQHTFVDANGNEITTDSFNMWVGPSDLAELESAIAADRGWERGPFGAYTHGVGEPTVAAAGADGPQVTDELELKVMYHGTERVCDRSRFLDDLLELRAAYFGPIPCHSEGEDCHRSFLPNVFR